MKNRGNKKQRQRKETCRQAEKGRANLSPKRRVLRVSSALKEEGEQHMISVVRALPPKLLYRDTVMYCISIVSYHIETRVNNAKDKTKQQSKTAMSAEERWERGEEERMAAHAHTHSHTSW